MTAQTFPSGRLPPAVMIAGPTASGKSGLAVAVAEEFGGVVINADSMQVYRDLRIVTARPSAADEARVPHRLYGMLDAAEACSAGQWRAMAAAEVAAAWAAGKVPVVVGGTGLYLKALREGLSPMPEVPADIRDAARALFAETGNDLFHSLLAERDPVMADRLHPGNSQRLVRAWEVLEATGRSLAAWQDEPPEGGVAASWLTLVLEPPRAQVYGACDGRFEAMVAAGALDEVAALLARDIDPALPAMKAVGLPELAAHVRGEIPLDRAIHRAQLATRHYAKRQTTWFRHQLSDVTPIPAQFSESLRETIFALIRQFLLTGLG